MTDNSTMEDVVHVRRGKFEGECVLSVDCVLMTMLRHHTDSEDDISAMLTLLQEPCSSRQIAAMLGIIGRREPFKAHDLYVERRRSGTMIKADLRLSEAVRWNGSSLRMPIKSLPATAVAAITPETPLRSIVNHPYICQRLVARSVRDETGEIHIHCRREPLRTAA